MYLLLPPFFLPLDAFRISGGGGDDGVGGGGEFLATIIQNKTTEEDAPPFLLDGGSYSAFSQVHPPMQHSFPFPPSFPGRERTPLLVWAAQKVKLPSSPPICFPLTPKFSPSSLGRFSLPCEGERRSTGEEHPSLPFRPTAHTFGAEGGEGMPEEEESRMGEGGRKPKDSLLCAQM